VSQSIPLTTLLGIECIHIVVCNACKQWDNVVFAWLATKSCSFELCEFPPQRNAACCSNFVRCGFGDGVWSEYGKLA
jgi:hypothetical protein